MKWSSFLPQQQASDWQTYMFYQLEACFLAGDSEEEISARKFPIPTDSLLETLIQSDSEYESVMPQTQLEKEKQFCYDAKLSYEKRNNNKTLEMTDSYSESDWPIQVSL